MFPTKLLELMPESVDDYSTTYSDSDLDPDSFKCQPTMKKSSSYPRSYIKQQLIDESNQEGDLIIQECNRFIQENNITPIDIFQKIALDQPKEKRCSGYLKFFDENKNYGFIVMDHDNSDIFVYADDLAKTGLPREYLRSAKMGNVIRFSFTCMDYVGKYNKSRKAVDLEYQSQKFFHYYM